MSNTTITTSSAEAEAHFQKMVSQSGNRTQQASLNYLTTAVSTATNKDSDEQQEDFESDMSSAGDSTIPTPRD